MTSLGTIRDADFFQAVTYSRKPQERSFVSKKTTNRYSFFDGNTFLIFFIRLPLSSMAFDSRVIFIR